MVCLFYVRKDIYIKQLTLGISIWVLSLILGSFRIGKTSGNFGNLNNFYLQVGLAKFDLIYFKVVDLCDFFYL